MPTSPHAQPSVIRRSPIDRARRVFAWQVIAGIPFTAVVCSKRRCKLPHDIELFSADGERKGYVNRRRAERMVADGSAQWIDQGRGNRCLRRTAETIARLTRKQAGVSARDMQVLAGVIGSQAEEFMVRQRVNDAWAGSRGAP